MVYFEFYYGLRKKDPVNKEKALAFLNNFEVIQTSCVTAQILSDLKQIYDKRGVILTLSDLMIASQVIENNMTLVTKDKDFENIDYLNAIFLN